MFRSLFRRLIAPKRSQFGVRLGMVAALCVMPIGCAVAEEGGPAKAAAIARAWLEHVRHPSSHITAENISTVDLAAVSYDAQRDMVRGRVWVTMALTRNAPPDELAILRRMTDTLNDPQIGGMYDTAGGRFVLDEQAEGYLLVRDFPAAQTSPTQFVREMKRMQRVAAKWTTTWYLDVAMIMHGKEPRPTRRVTLED